MRRFEIKTTLPKILCSTVVRAAQHGESHGGLYLVDLQGGSFEILLDWDRIINYCGRGDERGLRGISYYGDHLVLASANTIYILDRSLKEVGSLKNHHICSAHEIEIRGDILYVTSMWDLLLRYHLKDEQWIESLWRDRKGKLHYFDPMQKESGIRKCDDFHLNNVYSDDSGIYFSCASVNYLYKLHLDGPQDEVVGSIPNATHNTRPYQGGILYNKSYGGTTEWVCEGHRVSMPAKKFQKSELSNIGNDKIARLGWTRGLATYGDYIIVGSSPANVSVFHKDGERIKTVVLSNDVRNCIHGLEIWPF